MIVKKSLLPVGVVAAAGLSVGVLVANVVLVFAVALPFKWL